MVRYNILVKKRPTHGIPITEYANALRERVPDVDVVLAQTREEELKHAPHAHVITGRYADDELLERAENLKLFACYSSGYDHLPLKKLAEQGIAVTNASGVHAPNMAEQIVGNLLVFSRRLHEGWNQQQRREWRHYQARELGGSVITVVGLGAVGRETVARLQPFNVETIGVRYTPEKGSPTDEVEGFDTPGFQSAIARSDYLILCCPLTETTRHLVDDETLTTLPTDAVLINVARGGVVDTEALLDSIQSNDIRGAYLDVTDPEPLPQDHELWGFKNVLITPHMAGYTSQVYQRRADVLARNLDKVDQTGTWSDLENQVGTPVHYE